MRSQNWTDPADLDRMRELQMHPMRSQNGIVETDDGEFFRLRMYPRGLETCLTRLINCRSSAFRMYPTWSRNNRISQKRQDSQVFRMHRRGLKTGEINHATERVRGYGCTAEVSERAHGSSISRIETVPDAPPRSRNLRLRRSSGTGSGCYGCTHQVSKPRTRRRRREVYAGYRCTHQVSKQELVSIGVDELIVTDAPTRSRNNEGKDKVNGGVPDAPARSRNANSSNDSATPTRVPDAPARSRNV